MYIFAIVVAYVLVVFAYKIIFTLNTVGVPPATGSCNVEISTAYKHTYAHTQMPHMYVLTYEHRQ